MTGCRCVVDGFGALAEDIASAKALVHLPAEDGAGGYVITEEFVKDMLKEFKEQRLIHRRFAFQILLEVGVLLQAAVRMQALLEQPVKLLLLRLCASSLSYCEHAHCSLRANDYSEPFILCGVLLVCRLANCCVHCHPL